MSAEEQNNEYLDCSFVSIHYIICECGETFPSETGLKAHLEKEHPHKRERKEFKCGVCGTIFVSEDDCIAHYEEAHIAKDIKTELQDLDTEAIDEQDLEPDVPEPEDPHAEYIAMEVAGDYTDQDSEDVKPKIETLVVQCEETPLFQIPVEYTQVQEDGSQVLQIQDENGSQIQLVQITSDGQLLLIEPSDINVPLLSMVNTKPRPRAPKDPYRKPSIKYIICEVCGKSYASAAALKYHQRVHTGERPYACHLCPKRFAMPLFLQIHVRTHTGERPYRCAECPKAFGNKAALLRHDRVHTGEKPYKCPMCSKSFTQSNSMKLHVATVHLKQPAPYKSKTRKLRAQERIQAKMAVKKQPEMTVRAYNKIKVIKPEIKDTLEMEIQELETENVVMENLELENIEEQNMAVRSLAEMQDNVYEVVESEVVSEDHGREVYEIIYDSS